MDAAPRIILRTIAALGTAAIACTVLVSAAPRALSPGVAHAQQFRSVAALDADQAAVAQAAQVAESTAAARRVAQELAGRKAAAHAAAVHAAAVHAAAVRSARARAAVNRAAAAPAAGAARSSGARSINVWTSGGQSAVNVCRGAVDLTRMYGVAVIGEHWRCGGAAFPTRPGSTVILTGLRAGKYTVLGVVATLNAYTQNAGALPRGYQLLFQTCYRGDSHHTVFIALRKH
jgi:hypothetical protein